VSNPIRLFLVLEARVFGRRLRAPTRARRRRRHRGGAAGRGGLGLDASVVAAQCGLFGQGFALLGTLVGLAAIAIGVGPRTAPDIAYHVAIAAILLWGLAVARRAGCSPQKNLPTMSNCAGPNRL